MTIAKVWLVTGDDHLDDPAWGAAPVHVGEGDEVAEWLRTRPDLETLSVTVGSDPFPTWAIDFLREMGLSALRRH